MRRLRHHTAAAFLPLLLVLAVACGGSNSGTTDRDTDSDSSVDADAGTEVGAGAAADTTICRADATAVPTPYDEKFPTGWAFPPDTTAYGVEDRGTSGVIVTAISTTPFKDILDFLNHDEADRGFKVLSGETEDRDAEATWDAGAYRGRWAIRESATCPGETVIQVVAVPTS